MKSKRINCILYSITIPDGKLKANKINEAIIQGKNLFVNTLQDGYKSSSEEFLNDYLFEYSYNIPFDYGI
jgi:hypothetical protein